MIAFVAGLEISNSTFSANKADNAGGGAFISASKATIDRSTFSGNSAGGTGGGIHWIQSGGRRATNDPEDLGSAAVIEVPVPALVITRSAIHENSAVGSGGGIYWNTDLTAQDCRQHGERQYGGRQRRRYRTLL